MNLTKKMLSHFFVFTLGVVATSWGMWMATVYEDKYVTDCIRKMKRQLHLLQFELRVDMDWFDETLNWTPDEKRIALENHKNRPPPTVVQSGPVVKVIETSKAPELVPNPLVNSSDPNVGERRPSKTNKTKLNHLFENGVDTEHLPALLKNIAVMGNNINTTAGVRLVGLGSEAAKDFSYVPPAPFPDSYERRLKSEIVQFMSKNVNTLRTNTVCEFVKAVPPVAGTVFGNEDDLLNWLDRLELIDCEDCQTYVRLVREMYDQVLTMFETEPCRTETPAIQKINVE
jgi:hypothetical protein